MIQLEVELSTSSFGRQARLMRRMADGVVRNMSLPLIFAGISIAVTELPAEY